MLGYVKLYRKFEKWEWYHDQNTKAVFIHLLLNANIKPSRYQGHQLQAGELVTGLYRLAEALGLSVRNVRTALKHLQDTGEISIKATNKFSIVTIEKWADYSGCDSASDKQTTNERQTTDNQLTTEGELKKERKQEGYIYTSTPDRFLPILEAWNSLGLNKLRMIKPGSTRAKLLDARLGEYGETDVLGAIDEVSRSDFLMGRGNTGWTVTFDWLIKPNNFPKVLEGNYRNKSGSQRRTAADKLQQHYSMTEEWANE